MYSIRLICEGGDVKRKRSNHRMYQIPKYIHVGQFTIAASCTEGQYNYDKNVPRSLGMHTSEPDFLLHVLYYVSHDLSTVKCILGGITLHKYLLYNNHFLSGSAHRC